MARGGEVPPAGKSFFDLEETLGTNWLTKLGVILLVLGVVLFLASQWEKIPAIGKIGLGFAVGAGLLGGGAFLEKRERYAILGRAGIGGGWALLFFTTYAMHHVAASRIIESQGVDLALMLGVAAAMVAHTLRYNSQLITGMAFLLAFSTVTISRVDVYSLTAGAVLALALAVIVVRRSWFELELFGILASYLNHLFWLFPIIERMGANRQVFPEFAPSTAILGFYWAAYRGSYLLRRIETERQETVSTLAALLNAFLLLGLLKYQSVRPELAFYALLAIGAVEFALGQLPRLRQRRTAFTVLTTLGVALMVAAMPFKFSGANSSLLWLAGAETLLVVGLLTREVVFRRLAGILLLLVGGNLILFQGPKALDQVTPPYLTAVIVFGATALVFYADAHWVARRWKDFFDSGFDRRVNPLLSYSAGALALLATWAAAPEVWTLLLWAAMVVVLAWAGQKLMATELTDQAIVIAAAVFIRAVSVNIGWSSATPMRWNLPLLTVSAAIGLLYAASHFIRLTPARDRASLRPGYTWAAALLAMLLITDQAAEPWVAVWLALYALGLALVYRRMGLRDVLYQTHVLAAGAVLFAAFSSLSSTAAYGRLSLRLVTVSIVIGLLCAIMQLLEGEDQPATYKLRSLYAWPASLLTLALLWYELLPVAVAVAWAIFGVLLFEVGRHPRWHALRLPAQAAFIAAFIRILFFANLNAAGAPGELSPRLYTILPVAAIFYYVYWQLGWHSEMVPAEEGARRRASHLHAYMAAILIAAVLRVELAADWVIAGWSAMVVLLMAVAWRTRLNIFLDQALLLSAALAFRAVFYNFAERSYFGGPWSERFLDVGLACLGLLLALPFAFRLRRHEQAGESAFGEVGQAVGGALRRPDQVLFFVPVLLLTVLLALEMRSGMVTVSWGVLGVVIFVFALWVGERSYRLTGLGLLLLCVGKILVIDVWELAPRDRYVTFIVLGAALLLVSYMYSRYRETIRRYL